jgi:hypothetical protein
MGDWTDHDQSDQSIRHVVVELGHEFEGTLSFETVDRIVREAFEGLKGSKVRSFVPLFARRFARDRLRALAQP